MRYEVLERFRRRLLERRFALLKMGNEALRDAAELRSEREPDWEDLAALATTATLLETLGDTERAELVRIDEALSRMERGAYGECVRCHGPIELERLEAIPETDRCVGCSDY